MICLLFSFMDFNNNSKVFLSSPSASAIFMLEERPYHCTFMSQSHSNLNHTELPNNSTKTKAVYKRHSIK